VTVFTTKVTESTERTEVIPLPTGRPDAGGVRGDEGRPGPERALCAHCEAGSGYMSKVLVSWSSGKDSAWMVHRLRQAGDLAPSGLLTTFNEVAGRVSMHAVRRELVEAQAAALELPLFPVTLPFPCSNEAYEARMRDAVAAAVAAGFTHVAFGDLFLEDVRRYREQRLAGSGLTPIFPLWGRPTGALAREMVNAGLRATLTSVDPRLLDRAFAGGAFDAALLARLPADVDPCGEHGEFHTFAWAGPMFREPIPVRPGEIVERDGFVFADLLPSASGRPSDTSAPSK